MPEPGANREPGAAFSMQMLLRAFVLLRMNTLII